MHPRHDDTVLTRIVDGLKGDVEIHTDLALRFEYGSAVPWVRREGDTWIAVFGPNAVRIESDMELEGKDFTSVGSRMISPAVRLAFALTWFPSNSRSHDPSDGSE